MYPKLDIKDKELPEDFFDYFDKEGNSFESPEDLEFLSDEYNNWISRQENLAYQFMTKEQITEFEKWIEHGIEKQGYSI